MAAWYSYFMYIYIPFRSSYTRLHVFEYVIIVGEFGQSLLKLLVCICSQRNDIPIIDFC